MELDDLVCYCFRVRKRKIVNFIRQRQPKRASQLSECFGAGTGCGWCIPFLIRMHREGMEGRIVESDDISPEEYERLRLEYQSDVREGKASRNAYGGRVPGEVDESRPIDPDADPATDDWSI